MREFSYSARQRMEYIDFRFLKFGRINRKNIMNFFWVGVAQAAKDIIGYRKCLPTKGLIVYDRKLCCYVSTEAFEPIFLTNPISLDASDDSILSQDTREECIAFVKLRLEYLSEYKGLTKV